MSVKINDSLTQEVDELVTAATRISRLASTAGDFLKAQVREEISAVASRSAQLVHRLYGPESTYATSLDRILSTEDFTGIHANRYAHMAELAGILQAVQHDIKAGLLTDFRKLLQAEIFSDFLEMAEYLLSEGYKDAAAVILGSVLEDSQRKLAESLNISTKSTAGKPLTIDPLNVALVKSGAYNALVQKQITTWANLRNDAAHGRYTNYDADQVRQMLMFVQKFCADYLS